MVTSKSRSSLSCFSDIYIPHYLAAISYRGTPSIIDVPWAQKVSEAIEEVAKKHGATMAQVCIAWHLSKDFMTAPIIGTTSVEKLKDLVGESTVTSFWDVPLIIGALFWQVV